MQEQVTNKNDFSDLKIYIGLDVHKKSWQVTLLSDTVSLRNFNQPPDAEALFKFLCIHYPGAKYYSAYEAGFCGYTFHRQLCKLGIKNIVVNPADVPSSNKDIHYKSDTRDSRKIAEALRGGFLKGIYVFDPESEEFRSLFRSRLMLAKEIRRNKTRTKSFLAYRNIDIPMDYIRNPKSSQFITWLESLEFEDPNSRIQLDYFINQFRFLKEQRRNLEQVLRNVARKRDRKLFKQLQTIPGIGPISAIGIMAEIGDVKRFSHIKKLASYVGLIPRVRQSGETERIGSITYRHNSYLRPLLVEASWQAVRADPAMLDYYQKKCQIMNAKKAIIKVARKLLSRIMYVMQNEKAYERGIA
jgi:transposase